jgi:transposase InsO family protein
MSKERDWNEIGEIVRKVRELRLSYRDGAKRYGLSPWVLYSYNKRRKREAKAAGEASAKEKSHPVADGGGSDSTDGSVVALPGGVVDLICSYRRENPSYGFKRIQDILKAKYLVVVSRKQIRKVLKDASLLETCDSSFDQEERPAKGTRRFEATRPGEMWQMDVTYVYIRKIPVLYLAVILDDHSRFCVAAELCRDQRAETMIGVLHNACVMHGAPQKLLTDQGSGFYSWSREQTVFQEYLDDQKIEHIVAEPHSPQSQGKAERLIQTIREELLTKVKFTGFEDAQAQIRSFVHRYNMDRPHQGIEGKRPVDRFYGVAGEVEAAESQLAGRDLDLARGFVIYKVQEHRVCVVWATGGLQVYLDGKLLQGSERQ